MASMLQRPFGSFISKLSRTGKDVNNGQHRKKQLEVQSLEQAPALSSPQHCTSLAH